MTGTYLTVFFILPAAGRVTNGRYYKYISDQFNFLSLFSKTVGFNKAYIYNKYLLEKSTAIYECFTMRPSNCANVAKKI